MVGRVNLPNVYCWHQMQSCLRVDIFQLFIF